ncbi:MAG TPA: glycosyltransferase [Bryobacteraceae bacterium]|nr:glycosyltransferase [Bryobacteraceae bacterium]
MRVALFYQSLLSDWNHGNAHFLRGLVSELMARGHQARVFEPQDSWSYGNLLRFHGTSFLEGFRRAFPGLSSTRYNEPTLDLEAELDAVDLVLVHEWNTPALISRIAGYRKRHSCRVLFHDTHHRCVTDTAHVTLPALENYDGVLAFGDSVSDRYRRMGWGARVWTWHEAADIRVFRKLTPSEPRKDLVWVGNWGDEERTQELEQFFIAPVRDLKLRTHAYGVRYPDDARQRLQAAGIAYKGWVPNYDVPEVFSRFKATVHIPRRPYREALPGVPTIRVFEALACGIPLISAPWDDSEGLFREGRDFLIARDGAEMTRLLKLVLNDESIARSLSASGMETILARHTCAHRVDELLGIYRRLGSPAIRDQAPAQLPITAAWCGEEG